MSTQFSMHRVVSVTVERKETASGAHAWIDVTATDDRGNETAFTLFLQDKGLRIDIPADLVAQEVTA
jgi:hypothetical protein